MARTINTIYQSILDEKGNHATLDTLNSTSSTAIWRLWAYVTATAMYMLEAMWDLFKQEVDDIVAAAVPGTAQWYRGQALVFQYGDELIYQNEKFQYAEIDTTVQIIKRASVTEAGGVVFIKVAKLNESNAPVKLSNDELVAFQDYISQIKFAGTRATVITLDPDRVDVDVDVYYDPKVLSSDGTLIDNAAIYPVNNAVDDYLANVEFDGKIYNNKLIDAIQGAAGVDDIALTGLRAKAAADSGWTTVTRNYSAASGYYTLYNLNINYYVSD